MFYLGGVIAGQVGLTEKLKTENAKKLVKCDSAFAAIAMLVLVFSMFNPISMTTRKICMVTLLGTAPLFALANLCGPDNVYERPIGLGFIVPLAI